MNKYITEIMRHVYYANELQSTLLSLSVVTFQYWNNFGSVLHSEVRQLIDEGKFRLKKSTDNWGRAINLNIFWATKIS